MMGYKSSWQCTRVCVCLRIEQLAFIWKWLCVEHQTLFVWLFASCFCFCFDVFLSLWPIVHMYVYWSTCKLCCFLHVRHTWWVFLHRAGVVPFWVSIIVIWCMITVIRQMCISYNTTKTPKLCLIINFQANHKLQTWPLVCSNNHHCKARIASLWKQGF